jgi:hypothetical protein
MKKTFLLLAIVSLAIQSEAQTTISGKIIDNHGKGIAAATISLKGSAIATTADSIGRYSLIIDGHGKKSLEATSIGFVSRIVAVVLNDSVIPLNIMLKRSAGELAEVVINAGAFEASDKAKGASLTPIDAVTVAGSGNDLANSLRALPGAQQVGEKEGLFVRGGTNEEAKQFIDGVLLPRPNFSSVPGIL